MDNTHNFVSEEMSNPPLVHEILHGSAPAPFPLPSQRLYLSLNSFVSQTGESFYSFRLSCNTFIHELLYVLVIFTLYLPLALPHLTDPLLFPPSHIPVSLLLSYL